MLPLFGPNFFSETLGIKGRAFWVFFLPKYQAVEQIQDRWGICMFSF